MPLGVLVPTTLTVIVSPSFGVVVLSVTTAELTITVGGVTYGRLNGVNTLYVTRPVLVTGIAFELESVDNVKVEFMFNRSCVEFEF